MRVAKFVARNSRSAMAQIRAQLGDDAVVLKTRNVPGGVEVMVMVDEDGASQPGMPAAGFRGPIEAPVMGDARLSGSTGSMAPQAPSAPGHGPVQGAWLDQSPGPSNEPTLPMPAPEEVRDSRASLPDKPMNTLTFQQFVRQRLAERVGTGPVSPPVPGAAMAPERMSGPVAGHAHPHAVPAASMPAVEMLRAPRSEPVGAGLQAASATASSVGSPMPVMAPVTPSVQSLPGSSTSSAAMPTPMSPQMPATQGTPAAAAMSAAMGQGLPAPSLADVLASPGPAPGEGGSVMSELRQMRGLIASQLSSLAWYDGVRRNPVQVQMLRQLIGCGFSSTLARKLVARLPNDFGEADASKWIRAALARLIPLDAPGQTLLDRGGIYALVGPTGVGKTTTTAKIAAQFALRHGVQSIGMLTVDAYRIGAQDQLRTFGRLLGVSVHVVHDVSGLAEFMSIFMNKKLVLIDTVGVSQRDERLGELMASLSSKKIRKLLVLNATAQAETIEDVVSAYADSAAGVVVSKLDEAVKTGSVVDCLVRRRLPLIGMADGQRVPEDWHLPDPEGLVERALTAPASPVFDLDDNELSLLLESQQGVSGLAATQQIPHV